MRKYLLSLVAASFLTALVMAVIPEGKIRKMAGSFCGLALMLTALSPFARLDYDALAERIARLEMQSESARTGVEVRNRELIAAVIRQRTRSYILDKAAQLGCSVTVEIELRENGSYPYPCAVRLSGDADAAQREALARVLESELAIPEERQVWLP